MTRSLALSTIVLGAAVLGPALGGEGAARGDSAAAVVLGVGDTMKVDGAPIGCQVTRRSGDIVIDCRRAGRLAGTYGTLFDEHRVRVARFRSSASAKVVFKARHRGEAHRCDGGTARSAGRRARR
jgi:hypothetical protein